MGSESQTSLKSVRDPLRSASVPSSAAIATVRVKVIGNTAESPEAARAAAKRRFSKTYAFHGALPRFDDCLPHLANDAEGRRSVDERAVTHLSNTGEPSQQDQVPRVARPDATAAQDHSELHRSAVSELAGSEYNAADRTTLRVKALKPRRALLAHRLWQLQTPLVALAMAAAICVLCVLAVNLLTP